MRQVTQDPRSGAIRVEELPDPVPGPGELLVSTNWSLISAGTELAVSNLAAKGLVGKARARPEQARRVLDKARTEGIGPALSAVQARLGDPLTPGYSSVGTVDRIGEGVEDFSKGEVVACVGADAACHADRVAIPAPLCVSVPEGTPERAAAFSALGAIAGHGVRLGGVDAGANVAVVGLGLVGQLVAQLVTAAGARAFVVDPDIGRVDLALELGAMAGTNPQGAPSSVASLTGGSGVDAVLIAASGKSDEPIELAARLARDRATIVAIGDVGLNVPRPVFYEKELDLKVSRSYGPGRYDPAYEREGREYPIGYVRWTQRRLIRYFLEEAARGRVQVEPLITHEFPVEAAPEAYEALNAPGRLAVLLRYPREAESTSRRSVHLHARQPHATRPVKSGEPRVGLIGPGLFARSTLIPAMEKAGVQIDAVAGRSPARAGAVADQLGATTVSSDAEALIDDESVDILVIATRHDSHAALSTRALELGKRVFVEKPVAIYQEELERVGRLLGSSDAKLVVGFNRALAPATQRVQSHFANRKDPIHVSCRVNAGVLDPEHWLSRRDEGGGRLIGEGCHFVDLCSAVVGTPVISVVATGLTAGNGETRRDDSHHLLLSYADGSSASISYIASGDSAMPKERVEVIGSRRAAVIDDFRRAELFADGRRTVVNTPRAGVWRRQDKGHAALMTQAMKFLKGEIDSPPIPYRRLEETTRITLLAEAAIAASDPSPIALSPN